MKLALYVHPWDLRALASQGGPAALRDLGFDELALAVSYHDGRWLLPWNPEGAVRFLEDGTVHYRPSRDYGELVPLPSSEVQDGEPSPLESLCRDACAVGLGVRAWAVGTHNSRLGGLHPDRCVQNALGDVYRYALCPSQPAVQRYLAMMVDDLAAHEGLSAIEIEGFSWMGWKHSSHHEKAALAPGALLQEVLSLCFCSACEGAGADAAMRRGVADFLRSHLAATCAMQPLAVDSLPDEVTAAVAFARRHRVAIDTKNVATAAERRAQAQIPLGLQLPPDGTFRGCQMAWSGSAVGALDAGAGDEVVVTSYGDGPEEIAGMLAEISNVAPEGLARRLCIFPKAPQFRGEDDLLAVAACMAGHGFDRLSVYHSSLLPWRTLVKVAEVLKP